MEQADREMEVATIISKAMAKAWGGCASLPGPDTCEHGNCRCANFAFELADKIVATESREAQSTTLRMAGNMADALRRAHQSLRDAKGFSELQIVAQHLDSAESWRQSFLDALVVEATGVTMNVEEQAT